MTALIAGAKFVFIDENDCELVMSEFEYAWETRRIQCAGELPPPTREYVFDPVRGWRFDKAYVVNRVAIECQGGTWNGGRHARGKGISEDYAKFNAATLQGWRILLLTTDMLSRNPVDHFNQLRTLLLNLKVR